MNIDYSIPELIESLNPCPVYDNYYKAKGIITEQDTFESIWYSDRISRLDRSWFFEALLEKWGYDVCISSNYGYKTARQGMVRVCGYQFEWTSLAPAKFLKLFMKIATEELDLQS